MIGLPVDKVRSLVILSRTLRLCAMLGINREPGVRMNGHLQDAARKLADTI